MSNRGSPIRGLEPNIKEFSLESYALNTENERLTQLLIAKNNQIRTLVQTNGRMKNTYENQAKAYRKTIESLEKQLNQSETCREEQFKHIKSEYDKLSKDEVSSIKDTHTSEIQFLFKQIAHLRATIQTYDSKIQVRDHQINTLKDSYERELALNLGEINTLSKKIIQLQQDKGREIKDLTNKRELQRSRTTGVVNSKKESNQYIEKQLRKLNEEVLQKTIGIQNITRELNKQKKKHDETLKSMTAKIENITEEYEKELKQKEQQFQKMENILKHQILEYKEKEIYLLNENQTLKSSTNVLKKEIQSKDAVIKAKSDDIFSLKASIQKMREDHINQINNLMKQRRKRSSKSNLGSSRSLTSSLKQSGVASSPNPASVTQQQEQLSNKLASFLPIVKEESSPERKDLSRELSHSNIMEQQNQNQLARAVYHYDTMIDQLKKSHQMELQYYKMSLDSSIGKLKQKQNQLQDVLVRFSPLVKIHAEKKSLQEDRKQRIQRHWKADLSILEIMLKKYKIRAF